MGRTGLTCAVGAAFALTLAGLSPAAAQLYPGQDVTVNPSATGSQVLLYPGGKYGRVVRPLLQPGEPDPYAPIHLHMPSRHAARHVARQLAAKPPAKPKVETASVQAPPPPPQQTVPLSSIPSESAARLVDAAPGNPVTIQKRQPPAAQKTAALKPVQAKPAPAKPAPAKPKQVATAPASDSGLGVVSGENAAQKPARVASLESGDVDSKNLSKQMSIQFPAGAEEPAPSVLDTVRALAGDLNTALANGSSRIQLEAFGGKQGDKGSDARRLSLKRALIIRQLLIDDGIPSERIDVRAMGGASEGSPDRVDVFVRA